MGWMGRESRAKTPHDVANTPTACQRASHLETPPTFKATDAEAPPTTLIGPHWPLGSLVSALARRLGSAESATARLGSSQRRRKCWLQKKITGHRAHIKRYTTTDISTHHHHHHNEGPIDSAPARFLASMALRGSPCHRPRLSGPAATAARRLLFHTRQPGSRQEE